MALILGCVEESIVKNNFISKLRGINDSLLLQIHIKYDEFTTSEIAIQTLIMDDAWNQFCFNRDTLQRNKVRIELGDYILSSTCIDITSIRISQDNQQIVFIRIEWVWVYYGTLQFSLLWIVLKVRLIQNYLRIGIRVINLSRSLSLGVFRFEASNFQEILFADNLSDVLD